MSNHSDSEHGDLLDEAQEQAASSLERLAEMRVDMGISGVRVGEPSEAAKDMQDMALQITVIIALRKTMTMKKDRDSGLMYEGWNEIAAANAIGITHNQLRAHTKRCGITEPVVDTQGDLFEVAA